MRVPPGYELTRVPGATLIVRPGLLEFVRAAIAEAGTLSKWAGLHARQSMRGRGVVHVIDALGGMVVVRHYRRGGAVGPVLGDRYVRASEPRPVRELWLNAYARSVGVRTPRVAAAVIYPAGPFYRADIATVLVPDAMTLADATYGKDRLADVDRSTAWAETARLVRRAAEAGLIHADLNLRNILIARRDGRLVPHLLDLDRCRIVRRVAISDVHRMTDRLRRSAQKFATAAGTAVGTEFDIFVEALGV